jgi:hypothetical protein
MRKTSCFCFEEIENIKNIYISLEIKPAGHSNLKRSGSFRNGEKKKVVG